MSRGNGTQNLAAPVIVWSRRMGYVNEYEADDGPATLHAVMRDAVGYGLRSRYKPEKEIPHELMVLLMQMAENQRRGKNAS